jgi:hypothetical protein
MNRKRRSGSKMRHVVGTHHFFPLRCRYQRVIRQLDSSAQVSLDLHTVSNLQAAMPHDLRRTACLSTAGFFGTGLARYSRLAISKLPCHTTYGEQPCWFFYPLPPPGLHCRLILCLPLWIHFPYSPPCPRLHRWPRSPLPHLPSFS